MWLRFINKNIARNQECNQQNEQKDQFYMENKLQKMSMNSVENNIMLDDLDKNEQIRNQEQFTAENVEKIIKENKSILDQEMLQLKNQKIENLKWILNHFSCNIQNQMLKLYETKKSELTNEDIERIEKQIRIMQINEDLVGKVEMTIQLLQKLLENQLNHISQQSDLEVTNINNINKYQNNDLDLLFGKLEYDLRKSNLRKLELQFMLNITQLKIEEANRINSYFSAKTKEILQDYKNDFQKLIQIIKIKEKDIKDVTQNIIQKGETIKQLKEKIYGTVVLEHKKKQLANMYKKLQDGRTNKLETQYKKLKNPQTLHYDLFKDNQDKEIYMKQLTDKQNHLQRQNQGISKNHKAKVEYLKREMEREQTRLQRLEDQIKESENQILEKETLYNEYLFIQSNLQEKIEIERSYQNLERLKVKNNYYAQNLQFK